MTIGVLALQGDFEAHKRILEDAPQVHRVLEVRTANALGECDGLILPGGESTTMSRLCDRYNLWEPLNQRLQLGMGALGTCAGLILLSKNIEGATRNFQQKTLGALDVDVSRNAYGAQVDSFETDLQPENALSQDERDEEKKLSPLRAVFIRAPRITRCGESVQVLARHKGEAVAVRQGLIVASAFHPEIAGEARLHLFWVRLIAQSANSNAN
ncbi:MAG TPA: pyridoxal 5'-phosphate synthase glutaminase subunit PdxT [Abditibacteriaceae bacterium]|jgi:5'-phosphate synthase pdxT subunit|nr:pyridoxal 5'-phosphate synthase glutaminase subunit PdxT [Abditibacteriaceae bacterium]